VEYNGLSYVRGEIRYFGEINPSNGSITNKYYYANAQILKQDNANGSFYYVHDRLGSTRLLVNSSGSVMNSYTYNPFGEDFATEITETTENNFKFTGQYFDSEISQYYLRARMYAPALMRFTGRDPVRGRFQEPLTLHRYLYCQNDPLNNFDPTGKESLSECLMTSAIQASLGAIYGGATGGTNGAISGAIGGATSAWLGGAGIMGKLFSSTLSSFVDNGTRAMLDKEGLERAFVTSLQMGMIDQITFGVGNKLSKKFLARQFDKDFMNVLAKNSIEFFGKGAVNDFCDWLNKMELEVAPQQ
jgi:RHS repeat-associated protein